MSGREIIKANVRKAQTKLASDPVALAKHQEAQKRADDAKGLALVRREVAGFQESQNRLASRQKEMGKRVEANSTQLATPVRTSIRVKIAVALLLVWLLFISASIGFLVWRLHASGVGLL